MNLLFIIASFLNGFVLFPLVLFPLAGFMFYQTGRTHHQKLQVKVTDTSRLGYHYEDTNQHYAITKIPTFWFGVIFTAVALAFTLANLKPL